MEKVDNQPKVVVEIPTERGNFTPVSTNPQQSRLEKFRRGWGDAIALPDNVNDLIFDLTASVAIPALVTSCSLNFPFPNFIRFGFALAVVIGSFVLWQLLEIPEIRGVVVFRLALLAVGVMLGV